MPLAENMWHITMITAVAMQEEEVDRRVAAEKHVAEMKRALQTEQDQRKQAEERAKDSRALVRTLEQQLTQREPSQVGVRLALLVLPRGVAFCDRQSCQCEADAVDGGTMLLCRIL